MTGCMASLDTRHLALDTGPVGTAQPQNNFVLEAFFTTKKHTPVIGLRMLAAVRNIVSYLHKCRGKIGVGAVSAFAPMVY